uniref:T cell receptor beta chain MC.7.G5-like n=1 Tax=Solea senegalensis TaxID=28829 RepID=UPI001CD842A1|nr:T cell receptor beta chain MC.7.G5-like [Solea senegalensis]
MSLSTQTFGFLFICFHCQVSAVTFQPSPPQIVKEKTDVRINCSHNDNSLQLMLWYQQLPDTLSLTLIGYGYAQSPPVYEGSFEKQFQLTKEDITTGALIISSVNTSHTAVYFCAASTQHLVPTWQGTEVLETVQKALKPLQEFTDALSGEYYVTLSYVRPVLHLFSTSTLAVEEGDSELCSLHCDTANEAYFGKGTKLTVLEYDVKEPTVEVFRPSSKQCLNLKSEEKEKTLLCVASDFYPDHISVSWESGGVAVTTGVATDSFAARDGEFYKISSRLRVNAEDWYEKEYECIVTFFNGTNYNNHKANIYGEEAPKDFHIREKYLRATQTAKLSYTVFIIKSSIYGAFVAFLVWKLKGSSGKQNG